MRILLLAVTFLTSNISFAQSYKYPQTKKVDQIDTYFGTEVEDPYRWLEDDRSSETAAWVTEQNKVTESYLSGISMRDSVKKRLTALWNYPKSSAPFKSGNSYFVYTNNGLQNQFVFNKLSSIDAKTEVLLDPNTMSTDGTVNINDIQISKNGMYAAFSVSSAGSDWNKIRVMNVETNKPLDDELNWVKFSSISWSGNGFYYSRYDAPTQGDELKGSNEFHKVYFHNVGRPQSEDQLIYQDTLHAKRNFSAEVTDDNKYLIVTANEGTSGNNLSAKIIGNPMDEWINMVTNFDFDYNVIGNDDYRLIVLTNFEASRYKIVMMDLGHPDASYDELIGEGEDVLQSAKVANGKIICKYMHDATSLIKVFDLQGKFLFEIKPDVLCTIDEMNATEDGWLFYSAITFTAPTTIYKVNLNTKEQKTYFKPQMSFNSDQYVTKQVFYDVPDGSRIPMFIVHKKDLTIDGNHPCLLFGYGGFNISKTPEFKIERLVFLEQGGVFAMPCIRGGGEYGEDWHQMGTKLSKQNVFNDFIAAAEYLIANQYTNPNKLAIGGRSNGGLLVGACMTQHPELFRVALPAVGVLDMLRYHKFTIGWAWKGDYGSSENETEFKYLYGYSPLHKIVKVPYPATLVTTGDHDDRVVPAHSYKFIATLQEKNTGKNPVMIRIDVNSGHAGSTSLGSSKPVAKQIDEQTDVFTFMMNNLDMKWK